MDVEQQGSKTFLSASKTLYARGEAPFDDTLSIVSKIPEIAAYVIDNNMPHIELQITFMAGLRNFLSNAMFQGNEGVVESIYEANKMGILHEQTLNQCWPSQRQVQCQSNPTSY